MGMTTTTTVFAPTVPALSAGAAEPTAALRRNDAGRLALLALDAGLPEVATEIMAASRR